MAGNMIWGDKQSEAIRRIAAELYEQTKGIQGHKAYLGKCEELGFNLTIPQKGDQIDVVVSINICDMVWRKIDKEHTGTEVERTEKKMNQLNEEGSKSWREGIAAGRAAKDETHRRSGSRKPSGASA
jgi:hypothetical protein